MKKELAYTVVAADKSLYYVVVDRPLEVQEYSKPGGKPSVTKRTIPKQALVKMASNGAVAVKSSFEGKPVWVTLDGRQAVQGDKFEEVQDGGFTYRIPKAKDSKPEMRDVLQTQPESELNKTIPTMEISAGLQEKALIPRAIAIPDEDLHLGSKTFTPDQLRSLAQQRVIAVVGGDDKEPIIYGIDGHRIGPLSWLSPGISPVAPDLFMRRPADDSEFGFNVLFPVLFPEEVASVGAIIYSEEVRGGKYTRPKK